MRITAMQAAGMYIYMPSILHSWPPLQSAGVGERKYVERVEGGDKGKEDAYQCQVRYVCMDVGFVARCNVCVCGWI
jgi:hypothetical protein